MTKNWLRVSTNTALHYFVGGKSLCGTMRRPRKPIETADDTSAPDYAYCLQCKKLKANAKPVSQPAKSKPKDVVFMVTNEYGMHVSLHRSRTRANAALMLLWAQIRNVAARAACSIERVTVED